jgi:hypothetical protein
METGLDNAILISIVKVIIWPFIINIFLNFKMKNHEERFHFLHEYEKAWYSNEILCDTLIVYLLIIVLIVA